MLRIVFLFLIGFSAAWAQAPTAWTPEFSMRVQSVGSVVPSPDGGLVAYTQTNAIMGEDKSEYLTHIFLARVDDMSRFQLTQGNKSATTPAFSPDGRYVYFRSERTGKQNLFRIPVDGGEAERLTDWKGSLGNFKVSPDGKWVAFTARKEPKEEKEAKKEKRDFKVVDEKPENYALWVIPAEADEDEKREPKQLVNESYHVVDLDWSPDARFIAFVHQPTPVADDAFTKRDIAEVEVETGKVRDVAATGAVEENPKYSPDGQWLAFKQSADPPPWADQVRLAVVNRAGGSTRALPASYDEQPTLLGWTADSARLLFAEYKHTRRIIFAMPLDGAPMVFYASSEGTVGSENLNATGTHIGFTRETTQKAAEAFVMATSGGKPARVSRANVDLPKLPIGKTEVIRWTSTDGLEIEGLLTWPAGYREGERVPLILNIHGGPTGVYTEAFPGRPGLYPLAAFAAKGYAILRANPRGSSGYGKQFRFANHDDWGGMDYQDLMKGVDHVIGMGLADPDRLAVMGWSYGGFMTSWVITQTHRFQAAVIGAPVTNLWSFTGTSDIPGFLPDYFSGEPWENFAAYRKHSPLAFVKGVTTPALILHGGADVRVPVSQSYEYYHALKRQGATVKMVVYPRQPHGPREPKFILDIMKRHMEWVEKYVR